MTGLTPDNLRKAVNVKNTLTKPSAEGFKGTTLKVATGAAKGAATGGWIGAAKGAAISFAQTKAGRRVIAILAGLVLVNIAMLPVAIIIALSIVNSSASYGTDYRAGESAMSSGKEQADVTDAMAEAAQYNIAWPLYLALTTVQDKKDIDLQKLSDILARGSVRTLGAAGVVVEGKGLTAGETERELALAKIERAAYITALTEYGLKEDVATKVYTMALKWAFGETEQCTTGETAAAGGSEKASPIVLPDGTSVTLTDVQLSNAQKIIGYASKIKGVNRDAIIISLMAAMTESGLKNYANKNVPASLDFPHDAVGEDHDSVGFWQMRPHWGTTAELMNIEYQTSAFFGGLNGPNVGIPRGLLDIPGWESMPKGEVAQAVEVSAYPDRYAANEPLAEALLERFGSGITFCDGGMGIAGEAGHPMGDSSFIVTSGYGLRTPGAGSSDHKGIDFGAGCGVPIYAIADGTVLHSGAEGGWGNSVVIDHGGGLVTRSAHMPNGGVRAAEGAKVKLGEQIGTVGSSGNSSGCHLHFETLIDGIYHDPAQVLTDMGVRLIWHPKANGRPPGAEVA